MNFAKANTITCTFNRRISMNEFRMVSTRSILGLYLSQTILFLGILLILFNSFDLVEPGNYLGAMNWITITVFSIGLLINFISIPALYFSSFNNFKREIDFWDRETFWILPLFFFGTFFLYKSAIYTALILVSVSFLVIISIHINFVLRARKCLIDAGEDNFSRRDQYLMTLKYLSAYYIVAAMVIFFYKPM